MALKSKRFDCLIASLADILRATTVLQKMVFDGYLDKKGLSEAISNLSSAQEKIANIQEGTTHEVS